MTVRTVTNLVPVSPSDYLDWFDLSSRPLLELARREKDPARSVKIEWLVDQLVAGGEAEGRARFRRYVLTNFTQILRRPFQRKWLEAEGRRETMAEAAKRAGDQILDDAERVLWYGKPSHDINSSYHAISTCGGVLHYLRRRVYENDAVLLRELTPLRLFTSRGLTDELRDEEFHTHEWLWEFSLEVRPGHYERGMKPVCLPPAPLPVKAWAQGASLGTRS